MPEREDVKSAGLNLVIDEVADATQEEPPYAWSSRACVLCSHIRLLGQQGDGFAEVGADGS